MRVVTYYEVSSDETNFNFGGQKHNGERGNNFVSYTSIPIRKTFHRKDFKFKLIIANR